ncbi:MAG: tyrosine-protein phosphatase [Acidimicrobiales bacterium]
MEGALNFRDIGGYRTSDASRVAWRRVFRSGDLSTLTTGDLSRFDELSIATVVDLRSSLEWSLGRFPARSRHVELHHLPLVEDRLDPARYGDPRAMIASRYLEIAKLGATNVARALAILARRSTHPLVVHCTAGKDRTGVLVAVVLSLLGVEDETVMADYELSSLVSMELAERADGSDRRFSSPLVREQIFTPRGSDIAALLGGLRSEHGSIEGYVLSAGLDPGALDDLRSALVESQI